MSNQANRHGPCDPRIAVDVKMLELLVCPLTYGPLKYDSEQDELISERAKLAYPVRDGIPIMLVSEARQLPRRLIPLRFTTDEGMVLAWSGRSTSEPRRALGHL
jgi:uncharacterized protein YbaR (Trm112 family)